MALALYCYRSKIAHLRNTDEYVPDELLDLKLDLFYLFIPSLPLAGEQVQKLACIGKASFTRDFIVIEFLNQIFCALKIILKFLKRLP